MMTEFDPAAVEVGSLLEEMRYRVYAMARLGGTKAEPLLASGYPEKFEERYSEQYPEFADPVRT